MTRSVSLTAAVIFRLAFVRFSTEDYSSTFEALQLSNLVETWGTIQYIKLDQKQPELNIRASLADSYD